MKNAYGKDSKKLEKARLDVSEELVTSIQNMLELDMFNLFQFQGG
jgi:hypothetical protein